MMSGLSSLWLGSALAAVAGRPVLDAGGWFLGPAGSVSPEPLIVAALSLGFVGMSIKSVFDSILSDEEETEPDDAGGGEGLMPEEGGGDDFGELGGLDDGGDEFGEFEDDEFGDMDGGADTDELEHRLDELETEVGSLSSTVNTVRNENEQISETVDDVEENVRKLLDIYEMVTRGVNPFADDIDAGGLGGPGDESFGLFDDGGDSQTDDDLEEDIANADAEGFFDEDLVEDDDELEADTDVGEVLGDDDLDDGDDDVAFEDEFDEDFDDGDDFEMDDDLEMDSGSDGGDGGGEEGGKSFAELKDEYESGDAEWADGEEGESPAEPATEAETPAAESETESDDEAPADAFDELEEESADDALADDELFDTVIDEEAEPDTETEDTTAVTDEEPETESEDSATVTDEVSLTDETPAEAESVTDTASTVDDSTAAVDSQSASQETTEEPADESAGRDDGKPYLTELPDGFLADLIVVEWLEFLVEEVGIRATAEAIHYYERIDWIDEDVADQLQAYLQGFDADSEPATLTIDHHTKSLRYVSQLNGGGAESVALEQMPTMAGGGADGIQR